MAEMCIVVDENDKAIGADTKKNCELPLQRRRHPYKR